MLRGRSGKGGLIPSCVRLLRLKQCNLSSTLLLCVFFEITISLPDVCKCRFFSQRGLVPLCSANRVTEFGMAERCVRYVCVHFASSRTFIVIYPLFYKGHLNHRLQSTRKQQPILPVHTTSLLKPETRCTSRASCCYLFLGIINLLQRLREPLMCCCY